MCRLAELREFMSRKGGIRMVGLARCRNGRRTHTHIMYDFTLTFYRLYTYIHSWRPSPLPIIFHNLDTSSKKTSPYSNVTLLSSLFSFPCSLFPFPFPLPFSLFQHMWRVTLHPSIAITVFSSPSIYI